MTDKSVGNWLGKRMFAVFAAIIMVSIIFASVGNNTEESSLDEIELPEISEGVGETIEIEDFYASPPARTEHDFGDDLVDEIAREDRLEERMDDFDQQRETYGRETPETPDHDTPLAAGGTPSEPETTEETNSLPYGYNRVHKSKVYSSYPEEEPELRFPGMENDDDYITYSTIPTTPTLYSVTPETRLGENPLHFEKILLVDDDESTNNGGVFTLNSAEDPAYGTPYQDALTELGYAFDVYTVNAGGSGPGFDVLENYDLVIWVHGFNYNNVDVGGPTLSDADQYALRQYFDMGGFLWQTGGMWVTDYDMGGGFGDRHYEPGDFYYDYMHLQSTGMAFSGDTKMPNPMFGSEGGIEDGERYILNSTWTEDQMFFEYVGQLWPQLGQGVQPVYDADPNYYYFPYLGTSWEGSYKYVLMGVEWSWMNETSQPSSMQNILDFFFPPRDYGAHITPNFQSGYGAPSSSTSYTINITNTGMSTGLDVYDISYVTTEGWEVQFFEDDGVTPLGDNNLNGFPDTNVIGQYEYKHIVAKVVVPFGASLGINDTAEVTFRSYEDPSFVKFVGMETIVPDYGGVWTPTSLDGYARNGNEVLITMDLMNGAATDTLDLSVPTSPAGWTFTFYEANGVTTMTNTGVLAPLEHKVVRLGVTASDVAGTLGNVVVESESQASSGSTGNSWLNLTVAYEIEYNEGVESGEGAFTHGYDEGLWDNWDTSTDRSNSGTTSWSSGSETPSLSESYLESPYIFLEYRDAPSAKMDFYHWYRFFDASYFFENGTVDGGIVEVWDGVTREWNYLTPDEGYDGTVNSDFGNPLGGLEAFGGSSGSTWSHDYFDIYPYVLNGIDMLVINETQSPPGGSPTISLGFPGPNNIGIIDLSLYRLRGGSWYLMDDRDDYALDPATGVITLTPSSQGGDSYHAYYNYTLGNVVKFRWTVGFDSQNTGTEGWNIDDIRVRMPAQGAIVKPDSQEKWGYDNTEVSFNFTIENIGYDGNDQYELTYASEEGWSADFYDDNWDPVPSSPTRTPIMSKGVTKTYYVNVSIPNGNMGAYDFGAVWVNSTQGGTAESIAILAIRPYVAAWTDDFESGIDEYVYLGNGVGAVPEWHLSPNVTYGGSSNSLYFGQEDIQEYGAYGFGIIDTPMIEIPAGGNYAELTMWHSYDFEAGYDGGKVEIGSDNGSTYEVIWPERGYDWSIAYGWGNFGMEGEPAFSGSTGGYLQDTFEISDYIGEVIKVSFIAGGDAWSSMHRGWNIDDLMVYSPNYGVEFSVDEAVGFGDPNDDSVFEVEIRNKGKNTDTFTFSDSCPFTVTYMDDQWNTLVGDQTASMASGEARTFYINISLPGVLTSYTRDDVIRVTSDGGAPVADNITLNTFVTDPLLVIIDDFEGNMGYSSAGYDGYGDLLNLTYGINYDLVDVYDLGYPSVMGMMAHSGVIWATRGTGGSNLPGIPMDTRPPLYSEERDLIGAYLDGGGNMYLAGNVQMGAAFGGYGSWATEYFGWGPMLNWGNFRDLGPGYPSSIEGTAGTMTQGMSLWHAPLATGHPDADDIFSVDWEGGVPPFEYMFNEQNTNDACGLYLDDGASRRMSTTFHIINTHNTINTTHTRVQTMQVIVDWLFPDDGVWISPGEKYTLPGAALAQTSYTLEVKNSGQSDDTFAITRPVGTWTAQFYDEGWNTISTTGTLQPGEIKIVHVNVSVPVATPAGTSETTTVQFSGSATTTKDLITVVPHALTYNYGAETVGGWSEDPSTSLWHRETSRSHSAPTSWAFNDGLDYNTTNGVEEGTLYSPWIDLSGGTMAELSFWQYLDAEGGGVPYDYCAVYVTTDGLNWDRVYLNAKTMGWTNQTIDLTDYVGGAVMFKFYFNTGDTNNNDFEGWFIDDVWVYNPSNIATYDRSAYFAFGDSGDTETYDVLITNEGTSPETFGLSIVGSPTWTHTIYDETHTSEISNIALDPGQNTTLRIDVDISGATSAEYGEVFRATSSIDSSQWDVNLRAYVKDPVLLVSDDFEKNIDTYYKSMLDNNDYGGVYAYDWIDTYTMGGHPSAQNMLDHDLVIWHTVGSGTEDPAPPSTPGMMDGRQPLTVQEMDDLGTFLDNNGKLYMSSNAPLATISHYYDTGDLDPAIWVWENLGMEAWTSFPWPYPMGQPHYVWGVLDHPVSDGFTFANQISLHSGDAHPDCKEEGSSAGKYDFLNKDAGFESAFEENHWNKWITGTSIDNSTTRRLFTSWDLAAVDTSAHRDELMRRILTFLAPPPTGVTVSFIIQQGQAYPGNSYDHEIEIVNIGATTDLYDITIPGGTGWTTGLYEADGVTPLTNHGGTGDPDTGLLAPGEKYTIVVKVTTSGVAGDFDDIIVRATSDNDDTFPYTWMEINIRTSIPYLVLLVDDDGSENNGGNLGLPPYNQYAEDPTLGVPGHGTPYADELGNLGYGFDTYVVGVGEDGPPQWMLDCHSIIIWVCGGTMPGEQGTLTPVDQVRLANYLDIGGRVWLDSAAIAWDLGGSYGSGTFYPGSFAYEYLGLVNTENNNTDSPSNLVGVAGSVMDSTSYGTTTYWQDDGIYCEFDLRAETGLRGAWDSDGSDVLPYVASQWDDGVSKLFLSGVEWAHITSDTNRRAAMDNILDWFIPDADLSVVPPAQEWYGTPGSNVWYNITVTNAGNDNDRFTFTDTSPNGWTYTYYEASDLGTPIIQTDYIPSYGQMDIAVSVTIDGGASGGTWENGVVRATSEDVGTVWKEVSLTTLVYEVAGSDYKSVYMGNMPEKDGGSPVTLLSDDAESGMGSWTSWQSSFWWEGGGGGGTARVYYDPAYYDWHTVNPSTFDNPTYYDVGHGDAHSPDNVFWYGNDATYDCSNEESGTFEAKLQSPIVDLSGYERAEVKFWEYFDWGHTAPAYPIERVVAGSDQGGAFLSWVNTTLPEMVTEQGTWIQRTVDLTEFAGESNFRLAFVFTHHMGSNNQTPGWYVDDIELIGYTTPVISDTLLYNAVNWTMDNTLMDVAGTETVLYANTLVGGTAYEPSRTLNAPNGVSSRADEPGEGAKIYGNTWGGGSGTINKVEMFIRADALGIEDDELLFRWQYGSGSYGATELRTTAIASTLTTYSLDITGDRGSWDWTDVGSIRLEFMYTQVGNNDGGAARYDCDAMWIRVTTGGFTPAKVTMLESWGTDNPTNWENFLFRHPAVNLHYMDAGPFSFGDLVLTEADVLLISGTSREYSASEIAAIQQYCDDGHGIIGTGDFMDYAVLGNKELAPTFGLKNETVAWSTMFSQYDADIPSHPVMDGLSNPFVPEDVLSLRTSTGAITDGAIVLARANTIDSGVIAVMEKDDTAPSFNGLTGTDTTAPGEIDLDWSVSATDANPTITYNVYMALGPSPPLLTAPAYQTTNLNGLTITGLAGGQEYTFIVRAEDAYGNEEGNNNDLSQTAMVGGGTDNEAPEITNLLYGTDPSGDTLNVQYRASDIGFGNRNLMSAGYDIIGTGGFSANFSAKDGSFDSPTELVQEAIDISSLGPGDYDLKVGALDTHGNWGETTVSFTKGPKFTKLLYVGWSYISIPLDVSDNSLTSVLATIAGDYNAVQFYNNTGSGEGWEHYNIDDPLFADIDYIDHEMGFWVNVTSSSVLVVSGTIPGSTVITLHDGWNMVGYPSQSAISSIGDKLGSITYDRIAGPDQYGLNPVDMEVTDLMIPGSGYWIHVPAGTGDQPWTVS